MSNPAGPLLCALSLAGLLLGGCKQPVAGQCEQRDGYLCIHVQQGDVTTTAGLTYDIEVRAGTECDKYANLEAKQPDVSQPCPQQKQVDCKISRSRDLQPQPFDGGVPARLTTDGEFTADVDVSKTPGSGVVRVALLNGGECAAFGTMAFADSQLSYQDVTVTLMTGACAAWHKPCGDQLACGGTQRAQAQICCNSLCIDPPDPPKSDPPMTFIPAGSFVLGDSRGRQGQGELPCDQPGQDRFTITRPFYVDTIEITQSQYHLCNQPGCTDPTVMGNPSCTFMTDGSLPVNCVTHDQAEAFCMFHGQGQGELLTEAEWEWVAGRDPKSLFPWSLKTDETAPMGTTACSFGNIAGCGDAVHRSGGSPAGNTPPNQIYPTVSWPKLPIQDLAGNLAEWVADSDGDTNGLPFSRCTLHKEQPNDPQWPAALGTAWVFRGASYKSPTPLSMRTFTRDLLPKNSTLILDQIGIRCKLRLPL